MQNYFVTACTSEKDRIKKILLFGEIPSPIKPLDLHI